MTRTVRTFAMAFFGAWLPLMTGWLQEVAHWASGEGRTPFPAMSSLAYAGVAAAVGAFVAVVTAIWNGIEDGTGKTLPGPLARTDLKPPATP